MPSNGNGKRLELRLTRAEEKIIDHDKMLHGTRILLRQGMRMLVEHDRRMLDLDDKLSVLVNAQIEAQEAQKRTQESLKRFEDSLRRFLDRSGNGHSS